MTQEVAQLPATLDDGTLQVGGAGVVVVQQPATITDGTLPGGNPGGAAPVISNFSPSVGTPLNRNDTVSFDVTDDTGLLRAEIFVTLGSDVFVVHDGEKFRGRFTNFSQRNAITDGFRYTVRPNGGWTQSPTFEVHAVDNSGQEAT